MLRFSPDLLPDPAELDRLRDLSTQSQQRQQLPSAEWYTPMLLFGVPGIALPPGLLGVIPVIWDCEPIGWTMSSNVPGVLELGLEYADFDEDPTYVPIGTSHLPALAGRVRSRYREIPRITAWLPVLRREGEIRITVLSVMAIEQAEVVLYMRKLPTH